MLQLLVPQALYFSHHHVTYVNYILTSFSGLSRRQTAPSQGGLLSDMKELTMSKVYTTNVLGIRYIRLFRSPFVVC